MTPEEVEGLLLQARVRPHHSWTKDGLAWVGEYIGNSADLPIKHAVLDWQDPAIQARQAVAKLKRLLPIVKKQRFLNLRLESADFQTACDNLLDALFEIPVRPAPPHEINQFISGLADLFGALTGIWSVSRSGPASRFIGLVLARHNVAMTEAAIEKAVSRDRIVNPLNVWRKAVATGFISRPYDKLLSKHLSEDVAG